MEESGRMLCDELVLDFPRGVMTEPWRSNLPKIRIIQGLMETGGRDMGFPSPVGIEYHAANWKEGIAV